MSAAIQRDMTRGAAWMLLFKMLERSLGFISTLFLVRLLAPADFGIVAMALSFIAMAEILSAFGFDLALIQNQKADEQHYHAAWTCNVLLGLAITAVMFAAAQPIAAFYDRPELVWVVLALALSPTIAGLENIGVVAFRKELQFRKEFGFQLSKKLISVLVTVPLAFWLRNYWALVIGILTSRLSGMTVSYLVHPFRPRFSLQRVGDLMRFSGWMLLNNFVIFFKERTTDFVIGSLKGPAALGLYNVSNEFSNLPLTELAAPINRALIPGFARIQDDRQAIQAAFAFSMGSLALIVMPAAAGVCAIAPHLVPVVLGAKWLDATALMEVLALSGALVAFHSPICALLVAKNRPGSVAASHVVFVLALLLGLLLLLPRYGAVGAAYATLAAAILATPAYVLQLRRHTGIRVLSVARTVARPLLASGLMLVLVRLAVPAEALASVAGHALSLATGIVVGMASYPAILALLWVAAGRPAGVERSALDRLAMMLKRRP